MPPDAESPQPGESAAQDDEDLPEVNIQRHTCTVYILIIRCSRLNRGGFGKNTKWEPQGVFDLDKLSPPH